MRAVLNRQTKLHFKWDGPFVILDSTAKDTYQLATANGYTLPNLSNIAHLQKLDTKKRAKYNGDFREASRRLKLCDQTAKKQEGTNDINKRPTEAKIQPQCRDHYLNLEQQAHETQATPAIEGTQRSERMRRAPERYEG